MTPQQKRLTKHLEQLQLILDVAKEGVEAQDSPDFQLISHPNAKNEYEINTPFGSIIKPMIGELIIIKTNLL